jgi:acyl carrier protein
VPLGYPVDDTEILLLNDDATPAGVRGEIAIRSPYIARGYWQKEELTQATFLPDPEGGERRIYRTGDIGRLLPEGAIEYLGRKDDQVKIRGFRVEPAEIESVLTRYSAVLECIVAVRENQLGEKCLIAYVVPPAGQAVSTGELHSYLRERVPEYCVPSAFVMLKALPLTPTGKIDRRALLSLDQTDYSAEREFVPPRNPTESLLAGIWSEVLKLEKIGIHDGFFELGGHSLLATQVVAKISQACNVDLPLRAMFESPTIARISQAIEKAKQNAAGIPAPGIRPFPRDAFRKNAFLQKGKK